MRKLVPATLPKSATATFKEIKAIIAKGWIDVPTESSYRGTGAPGRLLEDMLGIKENNNDSPDLNDWEVKFHGGGTLITLLHKSPEPRGIMNTLVGVYGWEAKGNISFRHTIQGTSDRGFYVVNEAYQLVIRNNIVDMVVPHWTHDILLNAAASKLRRLIVVDGEYKKTQRKVRYTGATAYWGFKLTDFCNACVRGTVRIDFDARTTKGRGTPLRDHGTKFRVSADDIADLYEHKRKIT